MMHGPDRWAALPIAALTALTMSCSYSGSPGIMGWPAPSRSPAPATRDTATADTLRVMGGEMVYMADAARFSDCRASQIRPVAMEGDFLRMQRSYLERVSAPGRSLFVTFEGTLAQRPGMEEGSGNIPTVVVNRFIDAWPNQSCERARADAPLSNTYWRITRLDGMPVSVVSGQREPHVVLRPADSVQRYAAMAGCNQLLGTYSVTGDRIVFAPGPTTLMACPPPLDDLERRLVAALGLIKGWRVYGNTLQLKDENGADLVLLEAVQL